MDWAEIRYKMILITTYNIKFYTLARKLNISALTLAKKFSEFEPFTKEEIKIIDDTIEQARLKHDLNYYRYYPLISHLYLSNVSFNILAEILNIDLKELISILFSNNLNFKKRQIKKIKHIFKLRDNYSNDLVNSLI